MYPMTLNSVLENRKFYVYFTTKKNALFATTHFQSDAVLGPMYDGSQRKGAELGTLTCAVGKNDFFLLPNLE